MTYNWLSGFSTALAAASEKREKERLEWQAALGEPIRFLPDEDPENAALGFGVGFFRASWGVFSVRRFTNGYSPNSMIQYEQSLIDLLVDVSQATKGR